ncbi:unnamed protein product [Effrenium voratum]|nr:unnamed protein product [Effrenium voratum]
MAIGLADVGWFPGLQDPTGESTWPPAVVLMAHLSSSRGRALLCGRNVLELGAGNGELAKIVAAMRPRKLLATDLPHRIEQLGDVLHGTCAEAAALPWGDQKAVEMLCRRHFGAPHADVVLISDCLYTNWVEDSATALAVTVAAALGERSGQAHDGTALLAYVPRSSALEEQFFKCTAQLGLRKLPLPKPDVYLLKSMEAAREFEEEELHAVLLLELSRSCSRKPVPGLRAEREKMALAAFVGHGEVARQLSETPSSFPLNTTPSKFPLSVNCEAPDENM